MLANLQWASQIAAVPYVPGVVHQTGWQPVKDGGLTRRAKNIRAFRSVWRGVSGALFCAVAACAPALAQTGPAELPPAEVQAATPQAAITPPVIPGADAPAFTEALALWLADDEEAGLNALATLAAEGNRAAQILLGLIDKSSALQGPWLAALPRAGRIAVMRAPGGISGRSWLAAAANQPLAENWLALLSVEAGLPVVHRFHELGEVRAAREALVALAAREHPDLRSAAPEGLDPELTYLLWRTADAGRRAHLESLVPAGHPQRRMMGDAPGDGALEDWLNTDSAALALTSLCDARCPESRATCQTGAYGAIASHSAMLLLGSPAEALISQQDFLQSPRGQATVLRRILQSTDARGRAAMIGQMREHDECLANVLADERVRYHYRRPGVENDTTERGE